MLHRILHERCSHQSAHEVSSAAPWPKRAAMQRGCQRGVCLPSAARTQELGDVQRLAEANLRSAQTTLHGDSATAPESTATAKALRPSHRSLF